MFFVAKTIATNVSSVMTTASMTTIQMNGTTVAGRILKTPTEEFFEFVLFIYHTCMQLSMGRDDI